MSFKHKLSRRLSLIRGAALLAVVAGVSACTDGSPLGNEFGPSSGGDSPADASQIVGMLASSDNPTVEPEQSTRLRVVAIRADGLRMPVEAEWEALDGGELRDTVINGKPMTNFRAKEPGEYRLVSYDRGKKFRDTTRVTVPQSNSVSIAKMYLVPAVVSLVAGQGQQFFVYGTTSAGDSVPLVASLSTAEGGVASGLHYTAGSTAGSYQVIASRHGGPEVDTALVSIQAADAPPTEAPTSPEAEPTEPTADEPDEPSATDPAPYEPPTAVPTGRAPELPRVYLDTRLVAPTGRTIVVPAGGDFQGALNAAARGDVVELAAGATYTGNFVLPQKSGNGWVTIRTATALPPEGTRITPQSAAAFAKIRTPNAMPAIRTAAGGGASYYRLMGLDVGSTAEMTYALMHIGDYDNTATTVDVLPSHIVLDRVYVHGAGTQGIQRCVVLNSRSSAVIDSWLAECRIKGFDSQAIVGWNGPGPFKIVNNHLEGAGENLMFGGADPRIANLVPSNIVIRRNYLAKPDAWRYPILATPAGVSAEPASGAPACERYAYRVVARRPIGNGKTGRSAASLEVSTTLTAGGGVALAWSPVEGATEYRVYGRAAGSQAIYWRVVGTRFTDAGTGGTAEAVPTSEGSRWVVKNLLELKNARNVTVEYNVLHNNWQDGQAGYAVVLTPRNSEGRCTWCVVEQVTFRFNVVRNSAAGINLLGYDSPGVSGQASNITVRHNVFAISRAVNGGNGWFLQVGDEPRAVTIDHNTIDHDGSSLVYVYGGTSTSVRTVQGFRFTNNAARHNTYGIAGAYFQYGSDVISAYFPDGVIGGNLLSGANPLRYPAGNLFAPVFDDQFVNLAAGDFRLQPASPLRGAATDGADIGAGVESLLVAIAGVEAGYSSSDANTSTPPDRPRNVRVVR